VVRTFSPNKRIDHILLVAPVSAFRETLGEFSGSNFSYLLFDREGTVIFSEEASKLGQKLEVLDPKIYEALGDRAGRFNGYFDGEKYLIACRKSPHSDVSLLTAMPLRYVYQSTYFFISILTASACGWRRIFPEAAGWGSVSKAAGTTNSESGSPHGFRGTCPSW
jgi:hypothetical protein